MGVYGSSKYGSGLYGSRVENPWSNTADAIMWIVQVDWDGDGNFGGEIEPQSINALRWKRGRKARVLTNGTGQEQPDKESFYIDLVDKDGRYDSFNVSSPLYAYLGASGVALRVLGVSVNLSVAEVLFVGTLMQVTYDALKRRATLSGQGLAALMQMGAAERVFAACQSSSYYGWDDYFVIGADTPFPINYWKGRPGGLTLRECVQITLDRAGWKFLPNYGLVANAEQADYFYLDGGSAWGTLRELADGFGARLFFLRDGSLFVLDRSDYEGMAVGRAAPSRAQEKYGLERPSPFETLRNIVRVKVRPMTVLPFKYPVLPSYYVDAWSNSGPIAIAPGKVVYVDVEYIGVQGSFLRLNDDASDSPQYTCWSAIDRSGTDMLTAGLADVSILTTTVDENSYGLVNVPYGDSQLKTRLQLNNFSGSLTAYFFDLKVKVIGIAEAGEAMVCEVVDDASVALNGQRILTINSRFCQTAELGAVVAQAYADRLADRAVASPAGVVYQWSGQTLFDNLLLYDVGSHVKFGAAGGADSLANFGLSKRWLVVGQELSWLGVNGQDALVKLTFEKAIDSFQVEQVGAASFASGVGVSTLTWSHTVVSGNNRLLVVATAVSLLVPVTSVTFGGVAFTKLVSVNGDRRCELWYLVNPAVGAGSIIVTFASAENPVAGVVEFSNVDQAIPFETPGVGFSYLGGLPSAAAVGVENGMMVCALAYRSTLAYSTSGGTVQYNASPNSYHYGALATKAAQVGSQVFGWAPDEVWSEILVCVRPAAL